MLKTRHFFHCFFLFSCVALNALAQQPFYDVTYGNGNGIRLWSSDNYKLHMGNASEYLYGPVTNYGIKMNTNADGGHGWTWGVNGQTPVAAIGNTGQMKIAGAFESAKNIISRSGSSGYIALTADLPGYASGIYPTLRTDGTWLHFSAAGKYSGFLGSSNTQLGLLDGAATTKILLNTAGHSWFLGGNVGIGTQHPQYKLVVDGEIHINRNYPYVQLNSTHWGGSGSFIQNGVTHAAMAGGEYLVIYNPPNKPINFRQGGVNAVTIASTSNVGIGTLSPDEKLTVKGKIHAEEVIVDLSVPAPDYVFDKDYDLKSLEEVKAYIDEHSHLPDVPSGKQLEKDGVKVGEMEMILLRKIEELTIHMIETNKHIKDLQDKNERLERDKNLLQVRVLKLEEKNSQSND